MTAPPAPKRPQVAKDPASWQGGQAAVLTICSLGVDRWQPSSLPPWVMFSRGGTMQGGGGPPLSSLRSQAPRRGSRSLLGCLAFG